MDVTSSIPGLRRFALAWLTGLLLGNALVAAAEDAFWTAHVEPILQEHCSKCHSPAKSKSGLDLSSLATLLRGGDRGAAVLPGRPDDSLLILSLAAGADPHMPPKGQLTDEQVGLLKTWVSRLGTNTAPASVETAVAPVPQAPRAPSWIPPKSWTPVQVINRWIELGWKEREVQPARLASDATFVRRIYLDLAGRVPTTGELERFEKDRRSEKRERLVDELLAGPEYPRHFAEVMDTVLMGRRGPEWEGKRKKNQWFSYLERAFRENRPWDQLVRELILARPPSPEELGSVWYLYERKSNPQAMAEAVAPVVFGLQIKCAQCHDHLVAREIKQAHYWGLVAAFNRSKSVETPAGPGVAESAIGGFVSFANLKKESQPARLVLFHGATIDEAWPQDGEKEVDAPEKYLVPPPAEKQPVQAPAVPKFSRRAALADAVTRDNPLLARALVNRVWALMLGRGLVHPVDLMDSKHPPSHPELLDWLAEDFARSGYDVKRLVRTLALTRAYQLDSRPHRGRTVPPESFARALEKPLSAEQYFRSFVEVMGPPEVTAALANPREKVRQAFLRQFPDLFAAEYNATLQQALFLSNSPLVDGLLEPEGGNLTTQLGQIEAPRERARAAIRSVLGRDPERDELAEATAYLASRPAESGTKQLLWALLTSAEFQTNH